MPKNENQDKSEKQAVEPYFTDSIPNREVMLDEDTAKNVTNVQDVEKETK
ncbi:hypothetical protein GCM10008967_36730 [Bacillus carboniphilus]|uniref:Uncharacterized protein n=1 Tax=Bacillus carboniphilus TaxID=86663 RepID=A0ABP3GDL3_9BACI